MLNLWNLDYYVSYCRFTFGVSNWRFYALFFWMSNSFSMLGKFSTINSVNRLFMSFLLTPAFPFFPTLTFQSVFGCPSLHYLAVFDFFHNPVLSSRYISFCDCCDPVFQVWHSVFIFLHPVFQSFNRTLNFTDICFNMFYGFHLFFMLGIEGCHYFLYSSIFQIYVFMVSGLFSKSFIIFTMSF